VRYPCLRLLVVFTVATHPSVFGCPAFDRTVYGPPEIDDIDNQPVER
jgi:hypothetical protein